MADRLGAEIWFAGRHVEVKSVAARRGKLDHSVSSFDGGKPRPAIVIMIDEREARGRRTRPPISKIIGRDALAGKQAFVG